ncbi:hypothetical protein STRIP9103_01193 [Streptomyces ipomoeae 91-03]|uniref:Uncharacterized protein n=1 Tax=Streptomyces ipomoeae 91-03 TaxID=698759 RepID=L1KJK6_9ACTN|nr:hypothetical protein STRIP9103_01193 [Streptomyces ipomoeae 91-03]
MHGRRESRSIRTRVIADQLGGISFPHARLAIHVHRRREPTGERETCESVYAVTGLDAHRPARPIRPPRSVGTGEWGNSSHHIRDVTFAEDAPNEHSASWASPTPRTPTELDQALGSRRSVIKLGAQGCSGTTS